MNQKSRNMLSQLSRSIRITSSTKDSQQYEITKVSMMINNDMCNTFISKFKNINITK